MKVKITIDDKESFDTITDYTQHRLREILHVLSTPHEIDWKQKVRFETEEGGITIRMSFPQSMDFWVFLLNNV